MHHNTPDQNRDTRNTGLFFLCIYSPTTQCFCRVVLSVVRVPYSSILLTGSSYPILSTFIALGIEKLCSRVLEMYSQC